MPSTNPPRLVSLVHQVVDVAETLDGQLGQVFHVRTHYRVLPHPQALARLGRVQKVLHLLAVDLHVAHLVVEIRFFLYIKHVFLV